MITEQRRAYNKANNAKRVEYNRQWREKNKERHRAYVIANQEKSNKRMREWRKHHPEQVKEYEARAYQKNKERIQEKCHNYHATHKAERNAQVKEWRAQNPHALRLYRQKRRALERAASINLRGIKQFVSRVKSNASFTCYYCQQSFPSEQVHFDHIIPLTKGGQHSVDNLCTACPTCNLTKRTRLVGDWIRSGQLLFSV